MKRPASVVRRLQWLFLFGMFVSPIFWGKDPDYFYPWGVLTFTCLSAGLAISLWLAPLKWVNLPACLFIAGALLNFAVMAANRGFMPVIDSWFYHSHGCWRIATPSDHLLFLCDRIRLVGQNTAMGWLGALMPESSLTARLADFLMAGTLTASVGDLLIFGSIPLSVFWPNLIGKKWRPGETARLTLKSIGIVALMLGFSLVTNHEHAMDDPESFIFFLTCFFIAGCCFASSNALSQRARRKDQAANSAVWDSFTPEKQEELRSLFRKITGKEPKC